MENKLQIFRNSEFGEVRVVEINNEPWFVGKDISDFLNYSDASAMTRHLDEDEKSNCQIDSMSKSQIVINESGLYSSILRSKRPEAKRFKKWVTSEVLPSIRKHGEVWEKIETFGNYSISSLGRVKNNISGKILKPHKDKDGYEIIGLRKNNKQILKKVHRLVAIAFIPNPHNKPQVNHINEIKHDNNVMNLEWVTAKENSNWGSHNKIASECHKKKVICEGIIYSSIEECAIKYNIKPNTLTTWLSGRRRIPKEIIHFGLKYIDN